MRFFRLRLPSSNIFDSKRNLFLLTLFLLVFPKGGFKIHDIPITWGYLLLGLFSLGALFRKAISIHSSRLRGLLALTPFWAISAGTMLINGVDSLGMAISFWISFLFLPILFFCLFSQDIETLDESLFFSWFSRGVFWVACYGIILFIIKQISGHFLEIPLLTMNLGDLGQLESKHINRGGVFKLISTYNNGNLYGICLLMLLPLYSFLEKTKWKHWLVKLSLLLTLSRTVWIGLFFHEIAYQWLTTANKKNYILKLIAILGLTIAGLIGLLNYYGISPWFLFDPSLGGRIDQLDALVNTGLFSAVSFGGLGEIVYAEILRSFGWLGLLAFLFGMIVPLTYELCSHRLNILHQCVALGLVNYLFLSASDGAILLLPTMAFYWFLYSLLYRKTFSALSLFTAGYTPLNR